MTLANDSVFTALKTNYILGWDNISDEEYVGSSHGYDCDDSAVGTTNGAGPRNTQLFVIAADGTVLHALPGYWHADDLMDQLTFANTLNEVYTNRKLTTKQKQAKYMELQLAQSTSASEVTRIRSGWQGFDIKNEQKRLKDDPKRDTFERDAEGKLVPMAKKDMDGNVIYKLKPICQLVHERMATRPFVAFDKFDVEAYVDYGRIYYDNNKKVDGEGEEFETARDKAKEEAKQKQRDEKIARNRERRADRSDRAEKAREAVKGMSREERKQRVAEARKRMAERESDES